MSVTGLLDRLPDLDSLEGLRDQVSGALDEVRERLGQDPGSLVEPLTAAIGPIADAIPDLAELVSPLEAARDRIVARLPSGLDREIAGASALVPQAEHAVATSVLGPILDQLRAGQSINDIARQALERILERELLGQVSRVVDAAVPPEARAAVTALIEAAQAVGSGASDPVQLANFLAEHVLGVPVASLAGAVSVREGFAAILDRLLTNSGVDIDRLEEAVASSIVAAAGRIEALDPTNAGHWQAALVACQEARASLDTLRRAMQALPGGVFAGMGRLDLTRYKADLRQALGGLRGALTEGPSALGWFASLEGLVDTVLRPLDELTALLAGTSPAAFAAGLRSALDALVGALETLAETLRNNAVFEVFEDLQEIVRVIAEAISRVRAVFEAAIQAVVEAVGQVVGEFEGVRDNVDAALRELDEAVEALDVEGITRAVEDAVAELEQALAAVPLADLRDQLDEALGAVEGVVTTIAEATEDVLGQVDPLVSALEGIQFTPIVAPVSEAIQAIDDVVSSIDPGLLPEAVRSQLRGVAAAFTSQFPPSAEQWFETEVVRNLGTQFDGVTDGLRGLVEGLDERLHALANAVARIDPAVLLEPIVQVHGALDRALAGLSGSQLVDPVRGILDEALRRLREASPDRVLGGLDDAFEREVLARATQFTPSVLLQPLIEAFAPFERLVQALDFREALQQLGGAMTGFLESAQPRLTASLDFSGLPGVGGLAGQVQPVLGLFRPNTSMDDWVAVIDREFGSYRPSRLLEPVSDALRPVDDVLTAASDEVLVAVAARLQALAEVASLARASSTSALLGDRLTAAAAALEANLPDAVAAGLDAAGYDRLEAALAGIDPGQIPDGLRSQHAALRAAVEGLDPATILGPLRDALAQLPIRVRQRASQPVDWSDVEAEFGSLLRRVGDLLPGALRGAASPAEIREALAVVSPARLAARLDTRFEAFRAAAERFGPAIQAGVESVVVDRLGQAIADLSPAAILERFDQLFQPVRDAIASLAPASLAETLDQAHAQMIARLSQIHPRVIRQRAQASFDGLIAKLTDLDERLLQAVEAAIDRALAQVRALLRALDPQALLVGLGNFFAVVRRALEGLSLTALLDRLERAFAHLEAELTRVLEMVKVAFVRMMTPLEAMAR